MKEYQKNCLNVLQLLLKKSRLCPNRQERDAHWRDLRLSKQSVNEDVQSAGFR